jgi:hypothetical protein
LSTATRVVAAAVSRRTAGAHATIIVLAAVAVALLWLFPLVRHMDTAVLNGPNDATGTLQNYWVAAEEHRSPFTLKWNGYIDAPEGISGQPGVAAANAVQPIVVWSLRRVFGLVGAWNLFLIAGFVLSASLTYLLLLRIGVGRLPATFGAYVFAFNPYMFEKATSGHGGLVQTWIFPLLLLLLLRLVRRPALGSAAAVGGGLALASYLHNYYGLIGGFLIAVGYVVSFVRFRERPERRAIAGCVGVSILAAAICLVPAAVGLHLDRSSVGQYSHPITSLQQFGSRPLALLVPAEGNPVFGGILSSGERKSLDHSAEPTLFFGWTTMVLAAAAAIMILTRRWSFDRPRGTIVATAAVLIPLAYYMSLPRIVHVGPVPLPGGSWFLGHVTTVFRVYARFAVLIGLGLVVLAAVALDRLVARLRFGRAIGAAAIVLVAVELVFQLPLHTWRTNAVPAHDRFLASAPRGTVALYPAPNGESESAALSAGRETWFQTYTRQKLFFSTVIANAEPRTEAIRAAASSVEDPWVPGLLAAEGVRYVAVDTNAYRAGKETVPTLSRPTFTPLFRAGGVSIFRLHAAKVAINQTLHDHAVQIGQAIWGFQADANYAGPNYYGNENRNGVFWRWMRQDGAIHIENINAGEHILQFHAFSAIVPRKLTVTGPHGRVLASVSVPTNDTGYSLGPFSLPGGTYDLTLHADPGPAPLGASDPRVASIYFSPLTLLPYADFSRVR